MTSYSGKWYWKSDSGWIPYDKDGSDKLEAAYINSIVNQDSSAKIDVDDERFVEFSDAETVLDNFTRFNDPDALKCLALQRRKDSVNKR